MGSKAPSPLRGRAYNPADDCGLRELLSNVLSLNLTLLSVEHNAGMPRQTEMVQKTSAWAAILIVPTIVTVTT